MNIYVRSRGFSQENGYCWLPETPAIITKNNINELIQSESPSLVLARYGRELLLLVTGLEASERTDFRDRKIRNSVAWVAEDSEENEAKIRALATIALRDLLQVDIDKVVKFNSENGFEVSFDEISKINIEQVRTFPANLDSKIGNNSEYLRNDLAFELEERYLPKGNNFNNLPLVVVTGIKSESALMQAKVWRGLSTTVQAPGWKEPYKKSPGLDEAVASSPTSEEKKNKVIFLLLFIFVITSCIILFLLFFQAKLKGS